MPDFQLKTASKSFYLNYDIYIASSFGVLLGIKSWLGASSFLEVLIAYIIGLIFGIVVVKVGRGSLMLDVNNSKLSVLNFVLSLIIPLGYTLFVILWFTYQSLTMR